MHNKVTFYLTLGSTLAIAFYGVTGAWYVEVTSVMKYEGNNLLAALLFLILLAVGAGTIACFLKAHHVLENRELE